MKTYLGLDEILSVVESASVNKNLDLALFENCSALFVIVSYCSGYVLFAP
jgi:hypothetical protein